MSSENNKKLKRIINISYTVERFGSEWQLGQFGSESVKCVHDHM
jgi:hypothetical protein